MAAFARPASGRLSRAGAALSALLLAGCAAGGALPTPADPAQAAGAAPAPPSVHGVVADPLSGVALRLTAADGSPLAATAWGPSEPAAVILALHGFGDHGESTFTNAARAWAGRGIATVAIDQRGFGRNPSRGRWPGEDALIADAVAVSQALRVRFPCVPLTVVGHSMGGGVALAAAAGGLEADSVVLAAPAIWGGEHLNPIHRLLAWTAAVVVPDKRFSGKGVVKIQSTDNMEALRAMRADPLYLGRPSAREMMGLVRVTDAAEAVAGRVHRPALMLLGARDQIVPNGRVREVFDALPGPRTVIEYPDGWHLLFRDLQAATVWRDVADWALTQAPPACADGRPARTLRASAPIRPTLRRRQL